MKLKDKIKNIASCYNKVDSWIATLISAFILGFVFYKYTNLGLIKGNLGQTYAASIFILQSLTSLLFGINIALLWNKLKTSSIIGKEFGGTTLGSIFSLLVIGCPLCNITLASYLGLATFVSALPFFGIELKIVGLLLLLYSTNSLANSSNICELR